MELHPPPCPAFSKAVDTIKTMKIFLPICLLPGIYFMDGGVAPPPPPVPPAVGNALLGWCCKGGNGLEGCPQRGVSRAWARIDPVFKFADFYFYNFKLIFFTMWLPWPAAE